MQKYSEFSKKPSSVSSKFIIMDYRTIFKKVLERLCPIPTDRHTDRQTKKFDFFINSKNCISSKVQYLSRKTVAFVTRRLFFFILTQISCKSVLESLGCRQTDK